jgi:hypothetical protein
MLEGARKRAPFVFLPPLSAPIDLPEMSTDQYQRAAVSSNFMKESGKMLYVPHAVSRFALTLISSPV